MADFHGSPYLRRGIEPVLYRHDNGANVHMQLDPNYSVNLIHDTLIISKVVKL